MSLTIVDGLENFIELLKHDRKLVDSDLINMKNVLKTTKFNRNDLVNPTDNFNKLGSVIKRATLAVADFILNVEVSEKRLFIEIFELLLNNLPLTEFGPTYINEIFDRSEYVSGLCNVLVSHLHKEIIEHAVLIRLHDVLIQSIIFGPVHRKDLRKENETCMYIKSHGCKYSVNTLKPMFNYQVDCEVRLKILDLIVKVYVINIYDLSEDVTASKNISENPLINIIKLLMKHDDIISSKKIRYFNDSLHHRIKNRILQALLLLQHVMITTFDSNLDNIKVLQKEIIDWVRSNLCKESQQPSVRYQLEWLLIRCILSNSDFINYFWDIFLQGSEERAGSVCSFISVAYHLAAVLKDTSFIKRCVQEVLPWSMAQQFNIRLYAQVTLAKLFELFADDELPIQYTIIKSSLTKSLKQGTAIKNVPKLMSDFYFSIFHPINHLSLKSLFNDFPRLLSVSSDECVSDDILIKCFVNTCKHNVIPLYDRVNITDHTCESGYTTVVSLSECQPASWIIKARESGEQTAQHDTASMQKKFVPWRDMSMDISIDNIASSNHLNFSDSSYEVHEYCDNVNQSSGLVLVASLIDRPPNLGGLTRTCEVFGVQQLVLNSLHFINDKQFISLSMSSEKHVDIIEVKQYHLKDYLLLMKQKYKYSLVGAEQTVNSVKLNEYKFPTKTVLLLGNEKEGIPADLLPLLDVCVEVPQLGVIRSLNVHVTGALFLWEYTKQHKF